MYKPIKEAGDVFNSQCLHPKKLWKIQTIYMQTYQKFKHASMNALESLH